MPATVLQLLHSLALVLFRRHLRPLMLHPVAHFVLDAARERLWLSCWLMSISRACV